MDPELTFKNFASPIVERTCKSFSVITMGMTLAPILVRGEDLFGQDASYRAVDSTHQSLLRLLGLL